MRKLVRTRNGVGQLETITGNRVTVVFEINEYRNVIGAASHDDPNATIEGLGCFEGTIRSQDDSALPFEREALTLHFPNGERLKVLRTSGLGAALDVRGTGGLF
jgi:hypothetical protein